MDSIAVYDILSKAKYNAFYLQSHLPKMELFNKAILEDVKNQISIEQSCIGPYKGNSDADVIFSYQSRPIEIYSNGHVISTCNIIDTYAKGGNHHNYPWHTFNYNLCKNKLIEFEDVFQLQSKVIRLILFPFQNYM